jgi:rhamnosyltransferase
MIDVVIPVYKPDKKFDKLLNSLSSQTRQGDRLIMMLTVADSEGTEWHRLQKKAEDIFKKNASQTAIEVHPIEKGDFYHGRTRNRGIAYGKNPFVLCMTQDAIPADNSLLERLMEILEMHPEVSQVYARQITDKKAPEYISYTQNFNYPSEIVYKSKNDIERLGIKTIFCSNVCCMYRRDIFQFLGGFEDRVIFNEDMIFARKAIDAGYTICYNGKAEVIHYHKYSLRQQFKRNFDLAVSQEMNSEAFEGLSSTSEGKKMVKTILINLTSEKKYGKACYYVLLSAAKYAGYLMGKNYKHLSLNTCRRLSSFPTFWDN